MTNGKIEVAERPLRRGGGRPTREEALRRDARLLDVATILFMERGFDGTSIDAVAEAAGVSKPTVYARYRDKRDLFAAVLRGRIRDWLAPLSAAAEAQATETNPKNIETTLHELSRHMLDQASMPECAKLPKQNCHAPDAAQPTILMGELCQFGKLNGLRRQNSLHGGALWHRRLVEHVAAKLMQCRLDIFGVCFGGLALSRCPKPSPPISNPASQHRLQQI